MGALTDIFQTRVKKQAMQRGLLREVISGRIRPSILRSGPCPVLARCQSSSAKDGELRSLPENLHEVNSEVIDHELGILDIASNDINSLDNLYSEEVYKLGCLFSTMSCVATPGAPPTIKFYVGDCEYASTYAL